MFLAAAGSKPTIADNHPPCPPVATAPGCVLYTLILLPSGPITFLTMALSKRMTPSLLRSYWFVEPLKRGRASVRSVDEQPSERQFQEDNDLRVMETAYSPTSSLNSFTLANRTSLSASGL